MALSVARRGHPLRFYLTALFVIPLLTCLAVAGVALHGRIVDARNADRVESLVHRTVVLTNAEARVRSEPIITLARVVLESPFLRKVAGLGSVTLSDIGLSDAKADAVRRQTDAAFSALAKAAPADLVHSVRDDLRKARGQIDSGLGIGPGYRAMLALATRLSMESRTAITQARSIGTGAEVVRALSDVRQLTQAVTTGTTEMVMLAQLQLPGLGDNTATVARDQFYQAWAGYEAASADLVASSSPALAATWRATRAEPAVKSFDRQMSAIAQDPSRKIGLPALVKLYLADQARTAALIGAQNGTLDRAVGAAAAQEAAATRGALLIALLVGLAIALSAGAALLVLRSISRPLGWLSRQAQMVSQGELVDIASTGPREVRTVADGLAAAVENLRKVSAQATAVASGDLHSQTVLEPLPGPLGAVMHDSVTTIVGVIHERDRAQRELAHQATHDALTGLPNRVQAMMSIRHALHRARRSGSPTCLMFIDLDYFKMVNDSHGHAAGDEVLQVCAQRMIAALRESDGVFRLGGDEFVVLLEDPSTDFAFVDLAERLVAAVSEPIALSDGAYAHIGASIGIALCQDGSVDAERLLQEGDAAAYSAKRNGRGRVGIYDKALRDTLTHRAELERAIERALDNDEFVLHYQPVVEMATGRPNGFEALIRWEHPELGLSAPALFIPVAEKTTLINRIGRWTLNEAACQLARWDAEESVAGELTMAVNISGRHLAAPELLGDVRSALDASGIEPRRLIVEITETVLVDDAAALNNMYELRAMGVVVAIDDFGTGYTSIGQLPKLPIDVLKIDRSFTASADPAHQQLVRLIVEAAHAFGLAVVAEGVELADQVDTLSSINVDTGQGFFYARPQPPSQAAALAAHATLPSIEDQAENRVDDEPAA